MQFCYDQLNPLFQGYKKLQRLTSTNQSNFICIAHSHLSEENLNLIDFIQIQHNFICPWRAIQMDHYGLACKACEDLLLCCG